jgi:hypothetical protein
MTSLLHFLQNARFPAPPIVTRATANTTDVSDVDIGLVEEAWKAKRAIRDPTLFDNLCNTLAQILRQTPLVAGELDSFFSPQIDTEAHWRYPNDAEAKVRHNRSPSPCLMYNYSLSGCWLSVSSAPWRVVLKYMIRSLT